MPDETLPSVGTQKKKKRGCRGCLKWLGILILVFLVIGLVAAALFFRVPQRLGLLPNAAKRHLVYTPDRAAGEAILGEAGQAGMNTTGASVYVVPYKDGEGTMVSAVLDSRDGFAFARKEGTDPVATVFAQLAGTPTAAALDARYVTVVYVSMKGEDLMNLSVSRDDALAFGNGSLTTEQFVGKMNGDFNLPAMMGEQIDGMKRMLQ